MKFEKCTCARIISVFQELLSAEQRRALAVHASGESRVGSQLKQRRVVWLVFSCQRGLRRKCHSEHAHLVGGRAHVQVSCHFQCLISARTLSIALNCKQQTRVRILQLPWANQLTRMANLLSNVHITPQNSPNSTQLTRYQCLASTLLTFARALAQTWLTQMLAAELRFYHQLLLVQAVSSRLNFYFKCTQLMWKNNCLLSLFVV